jgi:hypothetical protein
MVFENTVLRRIFGLKTEEVTGDWRKLHNEELYDMYSSLDVGRDSSVGIATRYELDGLGIESRWGRDFPHPSRPALGPTKPPVHWVPGHSRG